MQTHLAVAVHCFAEVQNHLAAVVDTGYFVVEPAAEPVQIVAVEHNCLADYFGLGYFDHSPTLLTTLVTLIATTLLVATACT